MLVLSELVMSRIFVVDGVGDTTFPHCLLTMKTTAVAIVALVGSASAFAPQGASVRCEYHEKQRWRKSCDVGIVSSCGADHVAVEWSFLTRRRHKVRNASIYTTSSYT